MADYYFSCTFKYDGDASGVHAAIRQWLVDLGSTFDVKFRSYGHSGVPEAEFFVEALSRFVDDSVDLAFKLQRGRSSGRGKLSLMNPILRKEYSKLELQFSLDGSFNGLFTSTAELRSALTAASSAFSAEVAQVEADDFDDERSSLKYSVFQAIANPWVPVNFEWINVWREDVFRRIGWDLASVENVSGVTSGVDRGYVWISLADEPFSYARGVGVEQQRLLEAALQLVGKTAAPAG